MRELLEGTKYRHKKTGLSPHQTLVLLYTKMEQITREGGVEMAKSTISPEVLKIIKKSVDEAVKKAADAIIKANKEFDESQRNYCCERQLTIENATNEYRS